MLERRDEYENNIFLQLQPERYVEGVAEEIYYKSSIFYQSFVLIFFTHFVHSD